MYRLYLVCLISRYVTCVNMSWFHQYLLRSKWSRKERWLEISVAVGIQGHIHAGWASASFNPILCPGCSQGTLNALYFISVKLGQASPGQPAGLGGLTCWES